MSVQVKDFFSNPADSGSNVAGSAKLQKNTQNSKLASEGLLQGA